VLEWLSLLCTTKEIHFYAAKVIVIAKQPQRQQQEHLSTAVFFIRDRFARMLSKQYEKLARDKSRLMNIKK
jgi:hypothetical protein